VTDYRPLLERLAQRRRDDDCAEEAVTLTPSLVAVQEERLGYRLQGTDWAWPEGVLPILTWGCGMYAAVDCHHPGDPGQAWWVDSAGLAAWFEHYLNDDVWWNLAEADEDFEEMAPGLSPRLGR
jgi:hypothetical protein